MKTFQLFIYILDMKFHSKRAPYGGRANEILTNFQESRKLFLPSIRFEYFLINQTAGLVGNQKQSNKLVYIDRVESMKVQTPIMKP